MTYDEDLSHGVNIADMIAFYRYLRNASVPLDFARIVANQLKVSVRSISRFDQIASLLDPGCYIVHAAQDDIEHCFVLFANGPFGQHEVIDGYDDSDDPSCGHEPLTHLEWIDKVISVRRFELSSVPFKRRKSKTEKKRQKKARV